MPDLTDSLANVEAQIAQAERLWLFLDYDGTLADFADTPDEILPNSEVISLIEDLHATPWIRVAVVSGRRLGHIEQLVPVSGILLAGAYGIEMQLPSGERVERVAYERIRPTLDAIKPRWADLIAPHEGFYLEDKNWAIALHARFAEDAVAERVLDAARKQAEDEIANDRFRILGGHKFLEIGPRLANKGKTIDYLVEEYAWPDALLLYVGDDDKDEEAFEIIQKHGGLAVVVSEQPRPTLADGRLSSPSAVRAWLASLVAKPCEGYG
jgi:trehalose-phosphatase